MQHLQFGIEFPVRVDCLDKTAYERNCNCTAVPCYEGLVARHLGSNPVVRRQSPYVVRLAYSSTCVYATVGMHGQLELKLGPVHQWLYVTT